MAHVPHVYLAPPWPDGGAGDPILLPPQTRHHLATVLRRTDGDISYTDGAGRIGEGRVDGTSLIRGEESQVEPTAPRITVLAAPLHRVERTRTMVEKLAELGVSRLRWVRLAHTVGRPPAAAKTLAWAVSALEQSRGAYLLDVSGTVESLTDAAPATAVFVDAGGGGFTPEWITVDEGAPQVTLVVGPEGGFGPGEIPPGAVTMGLGDRVLRSETAALVACAVILDRYRTT